MATSLLAAQAPDSDQRVHLHPLVLLTASDLITRHQLRQLSGPVAGILLGQQQGAQISAEHAFTAKLKDGLLDQTEDWTGKRIQQHKDVHKNPALEVVGWFTLCPQDGPLPDHATLHKQLTSLYAENGIMLAIHPKEFSALDGTKGKLPLSIYESIPESESVLNEGAMQVDGKEAAGLRFRPVPFVIDTDETEMIAINYVAKGAGSAAAVSQATMTKSEESSKSGARIPAADQEETGVQTQTGPALTPDEEDQIAGMTTRLNSVKMLQERLQLVSRLVESSSPSYVSDQTVALTPTQPNPDYLVQLRNIQALLTRLSLLTPAGRNESEALTQAAQAQSNDVVLTSILSMLGQDVQGLSEMSRKFVAVEQSRSQKGKNKSGADQGAFGSLDGYSGRSGGGLISDSGLLMT